jgi:hypothetical protein
MNGVAFWVAQTVGATVPTALAQATTSPLPAIAAGARLDPNIAAPPLAALNLILGREGIARRALIQRAKIQCAKDPDAPRSNAPRSNAPRSNAPSPLRHPMRSPCIP